MEQFAKFQSLVDGHRRHRITRSANARFSPGGAGLGVAETKRSQVDVSGARYRPDRCADTTAVSAVLWQG